MLQGGDLPGNSWHVNTIREYNPGAAVSNLRPRAGGAWAPPWGCPRAKKKTKCSSSRPCLNGQIHDTMSIMMQRPMAFHCQARQRARNTPPHPAPITEVYSFTPADSRPTGNKRSQQTGPICTEVTARHLTVFINAHVNGNKTLTLNHFAPISAIISLKQSS